MVYPKFIRKINLLLIDKKGKKKEITLSYIVFISTFFINIFSGKRFYIGGGFLKKNNICNILNNIIITINVP